MNLTATKLPGVFIVELEAKADERGFYKRLWGSDEIISLGLDPHLNNVGLSYNRQRGTFRGMHYQREPLAEVKLVQCLRGSVFDVILDLREESPTYGEWISVELSSENHRAVYIPKGLAHGFQTLQDDSEVAYFISAKHDPASAAGVRWNDPKFSIELPLNITVMNERDANYPDFEQ